MTKTIFDPEADAFCACFAPEGTAIDRTQKIAPGVMIDLDAAGNLVCVEVLTVIQHNPQPAFKVSREQESPRVLEDLPKAHSPRTSYTSLA